MSVKKTLPTSLLFSSLLLVGCGEHSHLHPHTGDDSAHELPTRAQTVWTQQHEFFFENDFAVVGRATGFALHVSNLTDGSPRKSGALSATFTKGQKTLHLDLPAPKRPGIYLGEVAFDEVGIWEWSVAVDGDSPKLAAVEVYADLQEAISAGNSMSDEDSGITMLKEQQWPVRMLVETAKREELAERVPATARVSACRTHTARINTPIGGEVLPPPKQARITLGQQVQVGDILAVLRIPLLGNEFASRESSLTAAISELKRAKAELKQMEANFTRIEGLHQQKAKSDRQLEEAQYQLSRALVAVKAAEENAEAWSSEHPGTAMEFAIRAPITGQVIHAPTASGEWSAADELLFHIQDLSQLHVSIRVSEADLTKLDQTPRAHIPHPVDGSLLDLPGIDGELLMSAPIVHPVTHSAEVLYEIPNPGWLRSGMTLSAHLSTSSSRQVLSVPSSAIVDAAGIQVIFVQTGGESFARRTIRTGIHDGHRVEILEGLNEGEQVVTDGAYVVHLASLSGSIPEHSH